MDSSSVAKTIATITIMLVIGLVFPRLDPTAQVVLGCAIALIIVFALISAAFTVVNSHTAFKAKVGKSSAQSRGSGLGALQVRGLDTDGIDAVSRAEKERLEVRGKK